MPEAKTPLAAVVVGTYNNADHLEATIASVRAQTWTAWSCIVVDNGSTDSTPALIRELIEGDPRFSFFPKDNAGPSAGRNAGLRQVPESVEFVHFLDGDDMLHPAFLTRLIGHFQTHPEVGLVGCQFDVIDAQGQWLSHGKRSRYAPSRLGLPRELSDGEMETPFETFFAATGQGPFALFRKEVLLQTQGYDESFWSHEDSDIFCQMALLAPVHYLPDRLYLKRTHGHNLTHSPRADYGKFRRKWDQRRESDPDKDQHIERALRYYYGWHAPMRHFKVGLKAAAEFLAEGSRAKLDWSLVCLRRGFDDLVLRRELARRLRLRRTSSL
jgi:glycosyltransferase involved in cell wall biosynthesis